MKNIKTIKDQGEKQIEALVKHDKQLVKSSSEKESLTLLKQKVIFDELANERMSKIRNLSTQKLILIIQFIILRMKVVQKILSLLKVNYHLIKK